MDTDERQSYPKNKYRNRHGYGNLQRGAASNQKTQNLAYLTNRRDLFRDYECMAGETIIPLPDGNNKTIKELAELYPTPADKFYVYSYDHKNDNIQLGIAHSVRKTKTAQTYKITFDDGSHLIATDNHPFLMRNGEYKKVKDLLPDESVMPFYQKRFFNQRYRFVYGFSDKWISEHRLVATQFDRQLNDNEIVHHCDFNKENNLPSNLEIMDDSEHRAYHMMINNKYIWSPENYDKQCKAISVGLKAANLSWNGKRKGKNNPFYGKTHSSNSNQKRSRSLLEFHSDINNKSKWIGNNNGRYREDITFDSLEELSYELYKNNSKLTKYELIEAAGCNGRLMMARISDAGYDDWYSYKTYIENSINHKIVSIELHEILDVYDMTVDKYHNFATTVCFVHNSMDNDAIIASALDIYADECLAAETRIPLLNGNIKTIKELFDENVSNFWVYGLNEDGNMEPAQAQCVIYKGKSQVYKIILEDGTEIKATGTHKWVDGEDRTLKKTSELKIGDGIYTLNTKISDRKLKGYAMIKHNGKFEFVHRIVSWATKSLVESRKEKSRKAVIHHASFNKLNNDPTQLEWLNPNEHWKVHANFNKKIWANEELNHIYKEKTRAGHKKYWTPEIRNKKAKQQREFMYGFSANMSHDERRDKYGNAGSLNGMFGNGKKLIGNKNGRWLADIDRFDSINIDTIIDILVKSEYTLGAQLTMAEILEKAGYTFNRTEHQKISNAICQIYNVNKVSQFPRKHYGINSKNLLPKLKNEILTFDKNPKRNYKTLCDQVGTTIPIMDSVLKEATYRNFSDFVDSTNHRIVSIEKMNESIDVYDILNAGESHVYAIETNDGSKLFTHNCTKKNEFGDILNITSSDSEIQEILHNLFYDILNIEFNLWPWVRSVCKYGDLFLGIQIKEKEGIQNIVPLSAYEIIREEGFDPERPAEVRFEYDGIYGKRTFDNYEVAHFRLLSDSNFVPYGKSVIENARRTWKQATLLEDAMLIHRIMRAPERRVFKLDVGNINPADVESFIKKQQATLKKIPYINPATGDYNLKYNIQNLTEDFFLPVRGSDSGTSIENLPGLEYQAIDDLEFVQKRLFAALKIPRAYLGYEEDTSGKAVLAQEDFRFAGTIGRIQSMIASELYKIAAIHLYTIGKTDESLLDFTLTLATASTVYEQEKIRIWQEKIRTAQDAKDNKMVSEDWIYDKIYGLSEDEIKEQREKVAEDRMRQFRYTQIEEEGNDPVDSGQNVQGGQVVDPFADQSGFKGEDTSGADDSDNPSLKKGGRPRENQTKYGTDKHSLGRDPTGNKENSPSTSANEMLRMIQNMKSKRGMLVEKEASRPASMMDEENIIE